MFEVVVVVLAAVGLLTIIFGTIESLMWVSGVNMGLSRAGRDVEDLRERVCDLENHSDLADEVEDLKLKVEALSEKKSSRS